MRKHFETQFKPFRYLFYHFDLYLFRKLTMPHLAQSFRKPKY